MFEALMTAIHNNSISAVLGIVTAVQFAVIVYIGKYVLKETVHEKYFYEVAGKLDNILKTVQDTNTRIEERKND